MWSHVSQSLPLQERVRVALESVREGSVEAGESDQVSSLLVPWGSTCLHCYCVSRWPVF